MKRVGNLMQEVYLSDNLFDAYLKAARGKRDRQEVKVFGERIFENINRLSETLRNGDYRFGGYNHFVIYEPKMRRISAAHFRDRVVMHAVIKVCQPVFERHLIDGSFACRVGKGQFKAIERVQSMSRRFNWFAKLDVCKFFDSIDHEVLFGQLSRLFKDRLLLQLFRQIINTHNRDTGKGLPIGNLTSQFFANHYLSVADHYLLERIGIGGMARYMDDVILFDNDIERLKKVINLYSEFLSVKLSLSLHEPIINKVCSGIPFLGYVVFPYKLHLNTASRKRFRRKSAENCEMLLEGNLCESEYRNRTGSLYAFTSRSCCNRFYRQIIEQQGINP